jgi:inorganic phosphate transporter, PiT family
MKDVQPHGAPEKLSHRRTLSRYRNTISAFVIEPDSKSNLYLSSVRSRAEQTSGGTPPDDKLTGVLVVIIGLAAAYCLTNGVHDAGNAIAAPVMTGALRPAPAVVLAAAFHIVGALVVGAAVAATIAGIIDVPQDQVLVVIAAAVLGALLWSLLTLWWGLPCSSGHCLVGALAGAAIAQGGVHAVHWGGLDGIRPEGVFGSLIWLLLSAALALPMAAIGIRLLRRLLARASRAVTRPVRYVEVAASASLAFAHGSNDAQKTMGLVTVALVAAGHLSHFAVPLWVVVGSGLLLTLGTTLGGWRVVLTLGRRIYHLRSLDGLVSQGSSAVIVLAASLAGAPVSTTDVVAPAVIGVGSGERWHRVRWAVVREIALAWLVTLPVCALLGALFVPLWRSIA